METSKEKNIPKICVVGGGVFPSEKMTGFIEGELSLHKTCIQHITLSPDKEKQLIEVLPPPLPKNLLKPIKIDSVNNLGKYKKTGIRSITNNRKVHKRKKKKHIERKITS